jgi:hypothetical protein
LDRTTVLLALSGSDRKGINVLVVPARVLVLEPLEVGVVHAVDPPVVGEPARREELRGLVDVALVPDPVPGLLDQIVRDDEPVLLERDEVGPVVVVVDPPPPTST